MVCHKCKSKNIRCWDERPHIYTHPDNPDDIIEMPAGYFHCIDCNNSWIECDISVKFWWDITDDFYED